MTPTRASVPNVAVVSLPAFGAMSLRRRVSEVVTQLIGDMCGGTSLKDGSQVHRRSRVPALGGVFEWTTPDQDGVDVRIFANRGRLRLLVGMVRNNRPWRLVSGLRGALVGAFAFSAFYLLNATLWELALTMAAWQRGSVAAGRRRRCLNYGDDHLAHRLSPPLGTSQRSAAAGT